MRHHLFSIRYTNRKPIHMVEQFTSLILKVSDLSIDMIVHLTCILYAQCIRDIVNITGVLGTLDRLRHQLSAEENVPLFINQEICCEVNYFCFWINGIIFTFIQHHTTRVNVQPLNAPLDPALIVFGFEFFFTRVDQLLELFGQFINRGHTGHSSSAGANQSLSGILFWRIVSLDLGRESMSLATR